MTCRGVLLFGCLIIWWPAALAAQTGSAAPREPLLAIRGFVGFGSTQFLAQETFKAVFGDAQGSQWLAGGQALFGPGLFAEIGAQQFRRTGQRVFIFDGTVIPLGIANTVTITPITAIVGFRFKPRNRVVPYFGGGVGSYTFREQSAFGETAEDGAIRHAAYLFVVGAEVRILRFFRLAGEFQLASVPDGLGEHGVSREYEETNLGGRTLRVKLLIGR